MELYCLIFIYYEIIYLYNEVLPSMARISITENEKLNTITEGWAIILPMISKITTVVTNESDNYMGTVNILKSTIV